MGSYTFVHSRFSSGVLALLFAFTMIIVGLSGSTVSGSQIIAAELTEGFEEQFTKADYVHHGTDAKFIHVNSASQAYEGNRSLKIISTNSDPKNRRISELTRWMTKIEKLEVVEGEVITAEVYLKTSGVKESAELALSFFSEKGSEPWSEAWIRSASSAVSLSGNTDWTKVSISYEAPAGSKYVRPEFRLWDKGTLWVDNFSITSSGGDAGVSGGNDAVRVFETPGSQGDQNGAQVLLGGEEFIWVTATCKGHLVSDGNEIEQTTWKELNAEYDQLKTGSLTCMQVRTYDGETPPEPLPPEEKPVGPGVVVGPEEPQGGSNDMDAIPYEGPNQYDWSVVPVDDAVRTSLHGINKGKGQQLFTVDCLHSHYRGDDPIVFPGEHGASHNHEFFGDTQLNAKTTTQQILDNPGNTCEVGADRSAYWVPAVYQDGKVIEADNNKFYYKVGKVDPKTIQPMPVGLRMIAGNANATKPESRQVSYLFATTSEGKHTEPHTQQTSSNPQLFTTRADENGIRIQIQFPQCWDGQNLWLPNTKHMSYPVGSKCPDTHPVPLLQLMFNLGYTDATGGSGFKLSSGEWYTAHADFINGWHPETLERLTDVCLRSKRYCGLTSSESTPCVSRRSVRPTGQGCIELRKGETTPRFFGNDFQ